MGIISTLFRIEGPPAYPAEPIGETLVLDGVEPYLAFQALADVLLDEDVERDALDLVSQSDEHGIVLRVDDAVLQALAAIADEDVDETAEDWQDVGLIQGDPSDLADWLRQLIALAAAVQDGESVLCVVSL